MTINAPITFIGETDFRNRHRPFGILEADRRLHLYIIGKTGTGKSTLLESLIRQDIHNGRGLALLDPHGDLAERLAASFPEKHKDRLTYWNIPEDTGGMGFNPLDRVPPQYRALAASGLLEALKHLWPDFWGPRLEYILRNALHALLEQPRATLADILRLLLDKAYRREVGMRVTHEPVRNFWLNEFEAFPARLKAEAISPIQNKIGALLTDPLLYRIINNHGASFKLRQVMDDGRVLLVNLAKGRLGGDSSNLLGSLLVTRFSLAGLSRLDTPEEERRDFTLYVDEFQNFATLSLATMLSELRKFRLSLVLAHQYLGQLHPAIRDAVIGNVGSLVCFRIGMLDAEMMSREFWPEYSATDLVALPNHHIAVRLMIDGQLSKPFSARTIRPLLGN